MIPRNDEILSEKHPEAWWCTSTQVPTKPPQVTLVATVGVFKHFAYFRTCTPLNGWLIDLGIFFSLGATTKQVAIPWSGVSRKFILATAGCSPGQDL